MRSFLQNVTVPAITYEERNRDRIDTPFETRPAANSDMQSFSQNESSTTVSPVVLPVTPKPTYPIFTGDPYEVVDDFIKGKKFVPEPVLPGRTQPSIFTTQKIDGFNTSSQVSTISPQKHPFNSVTGHMQDELLEFINAHWPYAGLSGVSSRSTPLPAIFDFNTSTYIEPINK